MDKEACCLHEQVGLLSCSLRTKYRSNVSPLCGVLCVCNAIAMRSHCKRIAKALRLQCDCNARAMRLHAEKKRKEPKEKKRDEEEYYIYNIIIYNTILLI